VQRAIIIGGGPAGLTVALELLERTDIHPIVVEKSEYLGGICRTVNYKGNRIDVGGHRFFSKSDRVMDWWLKILPLQGLPAGSAQIGYHNRSRFLAASHDGPDPEQEDRVMLIRNHLLPAPFLRLPHSPQRRNIEESGIGEGGQGRSELRKGRSLPTPE
jgi:hypothetical protein